MDAFTDLLQRQPLVFVHVLSALGALAVGAWLLLARKGDRAHRGVGRTWALLMGSTALTSAFILDTQLPNIGGFTPIHALTLLVLVQLPRGVWQARQGLVQAHRKTMRSLYLGGCIVAGLFALAPGRFLGALLWQQLALRAT